MSAIEILFYHPYFKTGAIIARMCTCIASFIWAILVISQDRVFLRMSAYGNWHFATESVENTMAGTIIALSIWHLWTLFHWRRPRILATVVALLFFFLWSERLFYLLWQVRPIPPAGTAAIAMVVFAAGWSFTITLLKGRTWNRYSEA